VLHDVGHGDRTAGPRGGGGERQRGVAVRGRVRSVHLGVDRRDEPVAVVVVVVEDDGVIDTVDGQRERDGVFGAGAVFAVFERRGGGAPLGVFADGDRRTQPGGRRREGDGAGVL